MAFAGMVVVAKTLMLGVGNVLLADEGAGIHALHLFERRCADVSDVVCLDGGTLSFTLAAWIAECNHLIVFDAAQLHQPAGTVETFVGAAMDQFLGATKRSVHEVSLLDLMDIARLTEHLPEHRALIGIQPQTLGWDMQASAVVQAALPVAVDAAVCLMNQWRCHHE